MHGMCSQITMHTPRSGHAESSLHISGVRLRMSHARATYNAWYSTACMAGVLNGSASLGGA